jgi:hypothetical protein
VHALSDGLSSVSAKMTLASTAGAIERAASRLEVHGASHRHVIHRTRGPFFVSRYG